MIPGRPFRSHRIRDWKTWHLVKVRFTLWGSSLSRAGSLELVTLNTIGKTRLAPEKEFMIVASLVGTGCEPLKAINVQLSLKGRILGHSKPTVVVVFIDTGGKKKTTTKTEE